MYMSGLSRRCISDVVGLFLGLKWMHITHGLRNRIERWFRTLKERTKPFYNNMNARKLGILSMRLFLNLYTYHYNNLRTHQTLGKPPSR